MQEISLKTWQAFVESRPNSTIFHHRNWIELLAQQYHFKVKIPAIFNDNDVVAAIPFLQTKGLTGKKKLVSLPFTDEVSLLSYNENYSGSLLSDVYKNYSEDYKKIEVRANTPSYSFVKNDDSYVKHTLELSKDLNSIFNNFKKTQVQQCVTQAQKSGVVVKKHVDAVGLEIFYRFHLQVRKSHGLPVQPKSFFRELKAKLFDENLGFILVAYLESKPISASIFLNFNKSVVYKYSASDYKFLKYRPNNLVLWEAIRWAHENGYEIFNFGITPRNNHGLRKFKSGWGTEEIKLSYNFLQSDELTIKGKTGRNKVINSVISKLPLWTNKLIGELFYRYVG